MICLQGDYLYISSLAAFFNSLISVTLHHSRLVLTELLISHNSRKVAKERSPMPHLRIPSALELTAIHSQTLTFLSRQRFVVHPLESFLESHNFHPVMLGRLAWPREWWCYGSPQWPARWLESPFGLTMLTMLTLHHSSIMQCRIPYNLWSASLLATGKGTQSILIPQDSPNPSRPSHTDVERTIQPNSDPDQTPWYPVDHWTWLKEIATDSDRLTSHLAWYGLLVYFDMQTNEITWMICILNQENWC